MKHTMPTGPTATHGVVSLSLVFSLENHFHSGFGLGRETLSQMAALQLTFLLAFFLCSFLHYPQVKPRFVAK